MKKHMKKRSFALLAVAVCAVLAIPALAFGSAAMFSTENAVKAESALGIERQVDQFDTTVPAANEQPESAQPNADDRSAAVTNKASRPAANSQRFIDENSNGVCDHYEQGTCDSSWCAGEGLGQGGQGKAPIPLQDLHQGIDMNQLVGKDMLMQMVMECVTIEGLLIAKQPIVATMADIPDNEY